MTEHHDRSRAQEKRLAKSVNGQQAARSGAGHIRKGDVRSKRFLYEAKTTGNRTFTLKADDLAKVRKQAFDQGREGGVMTIELGGREYAVVLMSTWIEESGGG